MQKITRKGFLIWGVCLAVCAAAVLPVWADEPAGPTNAIQMVTYFPVPYAQYNSLYPATKLDIGLTNGFELQFNSQCSVASFLVTNMNLDEGSKLIISQDFKTKTATFGKYDSTSPEAAVLQFNNLYLKNWPSSPSSVTADTLRVKESSNIKLFGKILPPCSKKVMWKNNYLVCADN